MTIFPSEDNARDTLPDRLESLYRQFNRRAYVHPDPLEFLYRYDRMEDREIVAFVASALAYGRVGIILKNVEAVLRPMGDFPHRFLKDGSRDDLFLHYRAFRHRFASGEDMVDFLMALRGMIRADGSLYEGFWSGYRSDESTLIPAQIRFCRSLYRIAGRSLGHLLPSPERGSACKRLNLFFRWMVRRDEVDPGGWDGIRKDQLLVPLDTHMDRIGRMFGFTKRHASDLKTVLDITEGYRNMVPEDPVRYDFVLTRTGIRKDVPWSAKGVEQEGSHADL